MKTQTFDEITADRVVDLIHTALEFGSEYWIDSTSGESVIAVVDGSGTLEIRDLDGDQYLLDHQAILDGLARIKESFPQDWKDIKNEDDDAGTADIFLQLSLIGEVIYG